MRKVYQNESNIAKLPVAIIFGVGFTAILFGFIPFAHQVAKPERTLELVKTSAVEAPEWTIVDPSGPPVERRYCSMPELGDRVLRVVCIEDEAEIRIISAFIDRRARRPE